MKTSIKWKMIIVMLVVAVSPLLIVSTLNAQQTDAAIIENIENELTLQLESTSKSFIDYILAVFNEAHLEARRPETVDVLDRLSDDEFVSQEDLDELETILMNRVNDNAPFTGSNFENILVLDMEGNVVVGYPSNFTDMKFNNYEFFQEALVNGSGTEIGTEGFGEYDIPPLIIAHGSKNHENETIGVVVGITDFRDILKAVQGEEWRNLLRATNNDSAIFDDFNRSAVVRTYLIGANATMTIPPIGFEDEYGVGDDGAKIDILPYRLCANEHKSFKGIYESFDGEEVIGAALCSSSDSVYISEIPTAIALEPVRNIKTSSGIVLLITVVLVTIMSLSFAFYISTPINKLTKIIDDISKGKLDVEIDEKIKNKGDEIGKLANAFERTIVSLKLAMRKLKRDEFDEEQD